MRLIGNSRPSVLRSHLSAKRLSATVAVILVIGVLHCVVWSVGVGVSESSSRDFFSRQQSSLEAGAAADDTKNLIAPPPSNRALYIQSLFDASKLAEVRRPLTAPFNTARVAVFKANTVARAFIRSSSQPEPAESSAAAAAAFVGLTK